MSSIVAKIRKQLVENSDESLRQSGLRFFKEAESVNMYGMKTTTVHKIAKEFQKEVVSLPKADVFALCEELWKSGYLEESFIACEWSYAMHKKYEPSDFAVFDKWVKSYVNNWASCDTLCNHTVGEFVEMYSDYVTELKKWATSSSRWVRRAAAVTLIIPARKGKFLKDIFEIADILLLDKDDIVQKGYGWMLKAAGEAHQKEVFDYVLSKKTVMPRTALRYAIEKMPKEMREEAMRK